MNPWKSKMQKALRPLKSKISDLISNDSEKIKQITIEVNADLYKLIHNAAKREQTTEQAILLHAVQHTIETRSMVLSSKLSHQQKENNPLFHLDGFINTIK